MSYTNITHSLEKPIEDYVSTNWVHSEETNCFKKQVLARGGYLVLTPWSTVTSVADTIVGVGAGIASIATGGAHKATFKFAMHHLDSSRKIVAQPYVNLLKTLNPEVELTSNTLPEDADTRYLQSLKSDGYPLIGANGDGFVTHYVTEALKNVARSCYKSDNFFKRHIASRLTYLLLAISSVITRVVDGIIGVIAAVLSFLTLGKVESINNLAYRALQAPGIVNDLFYCTIKFINPWAGTSKN